MTTAAMPLVSTEAMEAIAAYIEENATAAYAAKVKKFKHYPGQTFSSENWMDRNAELRSYLSGAWGSGSDTARTAMVVWYIKKWGGISRLKDKHIASYAAAGPPSIDVKNFDKIASWSKALAMMQPTQFAIYDARVAFALNAIQAVRLGWVQTWFRIPTTQKGIIKRAHKGLECYATPNTKVLGDAEVYGAYLDVLKGAHSFDLERAEMILFALTDDIGAKISPMPTIPRPQL